MRGKLCPPRGIVQYGIQWLFGSDNGRESGSARLGAPFVYIRYDTLAGLFQALRRGLTVGVLFQPVRVASFAYHQFPLIYCNCSNCVIDCTAIHII